MHASVAYFTTLSVAYEKFEFGRCCGLFKVNITYVKEGTDRNHIVPQSGQPGTRLRFDSATLNASQERYHRAISVGWRLSQRWRKLNLEANMGL
jgi:hypothetical protein